ncbi:MAG: SCP2 sterol-binding domain-containing protein [Clostridia bacterium]|nr:SCP2 sterol-binding domain-containing protein [Clostridia bacterium]
MMRDYQSIEEVLHDFAHLSEEAADRLKGHDGSFTLALRDGRVYSLVLKDGAAQLVPELSECDCRVESDEKTLLELLAGRLHPAKALVLRKVRVQGNIAKIMELISLI